MFFENNGSNLRNDYKAPNISTIEFTPFLVKNNVHSLTDKTFAVEFKLIFGCRSLAAAQP